MSEEVKRIERCFWCGKPKDGSIVEETEETLKNSVINNYEPCENCKKAFAHGIHVIGVTKKPIVDDMFPIMKDGDAVLYPTGSMFVANDDFIKDMLDGEDELLENVLKERILLIPNEQCEQIVKDATEAQNNAEQIEAQMDAVQGETNEEDVQDQSN